MLFSHTTNARRSRESIGTSVIVSYFFDFWLFWAPLCLVVGAKKYFFGALYKNSGVTMLRWRRYIPSDRARYELEKGSLGILSESQEES